MIYLSSHTGDLRPVFHRNMGEARKRIEQARLDNGYAGRAIRCGLTPEAAIAMIISSTQEIHFETGSAEEMQDMVRTLERSGCHHALSLHPELEAAKQKRLNEAENDASGPGSGKTVEVTGLRA